MNKFFTWLCESEDGKKAVKAAMVISLFMELFIFWPTTAIICYALHRWGRNHHAEDFLFLSAAGIAIIFVGIHGGLLTSLKGFLVFTVLYSIGAGFFIKEVIRRNSLLRLILWLDAKHDELKKERIKKQR